MSMTLEARTATGPARNASVANTLGRRRRGSDLLVTGLCLLATAIGLLFLASILYTLFVRGFSGMSLHVFTTNTSSPGTNGGLLNAIKGSLIQTALATLVGTPIGLMVGIYLAEYAPGSKLAAAVRFVSDVLLSAPSILIGLFIYQMVVNPSGLPSMLNRVFGVFGANRPSWLQFEGGYSGWAGVLALAVLVIPIVVRTTEDMLRLIPTAMREAAVALGAPKWKAIVLICLRAALDGIMTGVLLAVARIAGETAPLLFTSLGNLVPDINLSDPMASLPVTIYSYAGSAYGDQVDLAWAGALIITLGVLTINIVARFALRKRS